MKRLLALLLILALLLPTVYVPQAQAAGTYDPYKAIAYAEANWNSGKGLCAEYVWNCLKAGGLNLSMSGLRESPYVTTGLAEAACRAIGKTYTGVKDFPMVATEDRLGPTHAYIEHPANRDISIGDLLFVYCETCGKTPHVVICSGYYNDSLICVYGHNYAQQHSFMLPAGANAGGHNGHQFSMRYLDLSDVAEYDCECKTLFDVPKNAWYHEYVHDALNMGLMSGVSDYSFAPEDSMTRAMVVTVLYRYNYEPQTVAPSFSDVEPHKWYTNAIAWAAENSIVGGVGNNRFDPNGSITREQLATILYRYTASMGNDCSAKADLSSFPDAAKVSAWARDAMQWAVAEGLINGSGGKLLPGGNATRTQVAAILIRYIDKYGVIPKEGPCGDDLTWSLSTNGTLTISGNGAMWTSYSEYPEGAHWSDAKNFIKKIIVEDGVTSIASFSDSNLLQDVQLSDSIVELDDSCFSRCPNLHSVRLSQNLTSIPSYCFADCSKLASIESPKKLTSIGEHAFRNCKELRSISLPESLLTIEPCAFQQCSSLAEITLPEGLKELAADAFSRCDSLTSLRIPATVENIYYEYNYATFQYTFPCRIEVDERNPNYCTDSNGVLFTKDKTALLFANEDLSGNYQIPESVTAIGAYAFSGCSGLTSVSMSDQVASIGDSAFSNCHKLQSVQFPTHIDSFGSCLFRFCASLKSVTIPEGVTTLGAETFLSCNKLEQITLPQSLTGIDAYVFNECYSLKDFVIPPQVTRIGGQDFSNCYRLRNIYFMGNAPEIFACYGGNFTIRYISGKSGWTSPTWNGYPTATWTP